MIIIEVSKDETIDRALKRYKRKHQKIGMIRELRGRKQYTKPSVKRRTVLQKARYKSLKYGTH